MKKNKMSECRQLILGLALEWFLFLLVAMAIFFAIKSSVCSGAVAAERSAMEGYSILREVLCEAIQSSDT